MAPSNAPRGLRAVLDRLRRPGPADAPQLDFDEQAATPHLEQVAEQVKAAHLSMLTVGALRTLANVVTELERDGVDGAIVEAGTARGGSAILMAHAKRADREMFVHDVFGQIPPPSEHDGEDVHRRYETIAKGEARGAGGQTYYGYREDLRGEVEQSFAEHGVPIGENSVHLVQGLFQDTLADPYDRPVALAHLDGDWYESTMVCLERIAPRVVPGGRMILDDYDSWSGCRTAVDEYFSRSRGFRFEHRGRLHVVKRG